MKRLLVNGEIAENGRGREATDAAAEACEAAGCGAELFWPVKTKDMICSGCGSCGGAGLCIYDPRGMAFIKAANGSDALLFAVPVGFFGASMDVRNLLRRAAAIAERCKTPPLAGKRAAVLLFGRKSGVGQAERQLRMMFKGCGLQPAGAAPFAWLEAGEARESAAAAVKSWLADFEEAER